MSTTTTADRSTLFDRAARVFDGWTEPDTGARVLRVVPKNFPPGPGLWSTMYHQFQCFLGGGRQILLHASSVILGGHGKQVYAVDLTSGDATDLAPPGYYIREVNDSTQLATLRATTEPSDVVLWDLHAGRELARMSLPDGWDGSAVNLVSDGRRAIVMQHRGKYYTEPVQSRHYLLTPGEPPRLILDAHGYYCSHVVSCPANAELYAYDRWPSPQRYIDQAITIRSLDGTFEEPVKLDAAALRPNDMFGARDHYVWTPDGRYIVSYLYLGCHQFVPHSAGYDARKFNHFEFDWHLSATDWRTGVDFSSKYPPGRWGGHMQITPDSRYILMAGGPGFDKLFATDLQALRHGWNEHLICSYPKTVSAGNNSDPFPMPFALPDGSGVIFNAGWFGPDHGVYLAEWPKSLR